MAELLPALFTHLVAFLLFIWLLNRYATGPVLRILDERREKIAKEFDQIATAEKRAGQLRDDYERRLREIDEEARKRMTEEVNKGKRIADEIAENARAEASAALEKARATIDLQMDKARVEMKEEVVTLVLAVTERLLRDKMDAPRQRDQVRAFITQLEIPRGTPGNPAEN